MPCMTRKLGENAKKEIRNTIENIVRNLPVGCVKSTEISDECERLSNHFGVTKSRIYEMTTDIRPKTKTRRDKGKRTVDLKTDANLQLVAGWVLEFDMTPADALLQAKEEGIEIPIELPTFQRYLKEQGLHKSARRTESTPHRRFEAEKPGDMYQFDISGLKERFYDHATRKLVTVTSLEVSKNHPNTKKNRVKVWRFVLVDDFSRYTFVRYYAVDKPSSSHVVDFLLQAYFEIGVPKVLYTDNDAVIKGGRTKRATQILNKSLENLGGYEVVPHLPGNSRATGKVERKHQVIENCEKVLGMLLAEGREIDIQTLNTEFAVNVCKKENHRVHRTTGEKAIDRWNSKLSVVRKVDYDVLKSAFLADEFDVRINGDLTFSLKGQTFQLPTDSEHRFSRLRYSLTKQKVKVVFPDEADFFTLIDFDGNEFDLLKNIAAPDVAGDFKTTAEDESIQLRKKVKAMAKEHAKLQKENIKKGDGGTNIIYHDVDVVEVKDDPVVKPFPKPITDVTDNISKHLPGRLGGSYTGTLMDFASAVKNYKSEFSDLSECKDFFDSIFENRNATLPQTTIESELDNYHRNNNQNYGKLKAV